MVVGSYSNMFCYYFKSSTYYYNNYIYYYYYSNYYYYGYGSSVDKRITPYYAED